jgi:hypothetical protein
MMGVFWAAGLPWRATAARTFPAQWMMMHRAARRRHGVVVGRGRHDRYVRAFYYGF